MNKGLNKGFISKSSGLLMIMKKMESWQKVARLRTGNCGKSFNVN